MHYNQISFPDLKPLAMVNELMNQTEYQYLAIIQYDDIIDWYLLKDLKQSTINQLSYYLYIAYDMRQFSNVNVKVIRIDSGSNDILQGKVIDTMNANNALMVYDDINQYSS